MLKSEDVAKFVKEISDLTNSFVDKVYKLIEFNDNINRMMVDSRNLEEYNKALQKRIDELLGEIERLSNENEVLRSKLKQYKENSKSLIKEVQETSEIEDKKTKKILDGLKKIIESEVKI